MPSHLRRINERGLVHFWTISCFDRLGFFYDDHIKAVAIDGLRLLQTKFGICLVGYVIMPEHVHVLLLPHRRGEDEPIPIDKLLNAFKQHVGYHGKESLRDYWRKHGQFWSQPLNAWALANTDEKPIWTARGYDFIVNRQDTLIEKLNYCHKNPLTRGLVERPQEWAWSSYRHYESGGQVILAMDWTGQWPVVW